MPKTNCQECNVIELGLYEEIAESGVYFYRTFNHGVIFMSREHGTVNSVSSPILAMVYQNAKMWAEGVVKTGEYNAFSMVVTMYDNGTSHHPLVLVQFDG